MTSAEQRYGQGHAESVLRSQHWRTVDNSAAYLAERLRGGLTVLDVGCGPGTITVDIAHRVHPGRVVGIDVSDTVLETARRNATECGADNVTFLRADITGIRDIRDIRDISDIAGMKGIDDTADRDALHSPVPAGFDIVHAHQVLLHLTDPVAALRTMLRLTRAGGLVAARDTDYAGAMWWPRDTRLDRWLEIYHLVARDNGAEPDAGRRLLAWAHAAGASEVTPSASIWCHSTPAERAWWGGQWAERIVRSRIAEQAVAYGHATGDELREIAAAWRAWAAHPDGWFAIPHGEILCHP